MKLLPREAWQYAILLIVLLATAAVAVQSTIEFLTRHLSQDFHGSTILILWSLTMGFMLIAGAFSLWAIRFSAEAEGRRRVGRFVDALDFLKDGLLTLDTKGRITGSNVSVKGLAEREVANKEHIRDVFPCLHDEDMSTLLETNDPDEVERECGKSIRTLRFRSQPSEGLRLIQISDVTAIQSVQRRNRQIAHLQLIGQVTSGVARDFNEILCNISGHASLMDHFAPESAEIRTSLAEVSDNAERGIALAGKLLQFDSVALAGKPTERLAEHITTAAETLRHALGPEWMVETDIPEEAVPVSLSGTQVEQIVIHLSLYVTDAAPTAGTLRLQLQNRPVTSRDGTTSRAAARLTITTASDATDAGAESSPDETDIANDGSNALLSILRSLIREVGGSLEITQAVNGSCTCSVTMPLGVPALGPDTDDLPEALASYIAKWRILVARHGRSPSELERRLAQIDVDVQKEEDIVTTLAHAQGKSAPDVMVVGHEILGPEAVPLLKALVKLCPATGIVLLTETPDAFLGSGISDIIVEANNAGANRILRAMIEARSLAMQRQTA